MDAENILENFEWNQLSLERLQQLESQISKARNIKRRDLKLTKATAEIAKIMGTRQL